MARTSTNVAALAFTDTPTVTGWDAGKVGRQAMGVKVGE